MFFEYIVVGSGPSGAMAAQTLAEAGKQVAVLDVGISDRSLEEITPEKDFEHIRCSEENQREYLLGKQLECLPTDEVKVGAQLTPARRYMIEGVEQLTPLHSETFRPMESLALGGLGCGWGLGCYTYSEKELKRVGLNPEKIFTAYQIVANRIGISGGQDDLSSYFAADLKGLQPPVKMDTATRFLYEKYLRKKEKFNQQGVFMGHPVIAMLTQPKDDRQANPYLDMDFYADFGHSCYRPWMTINNLSEKKLITYIPKNLVLSFKENADSVEVETYDTDTKGRNLFKCHRLILAGGALSTARIVLRSFKDKITRLPLLCNPYVYMPCINISMLGKKHEALKTSMVQAQMLIDEGLKGEDILTVSLYTYRSLMLFRLLGNLPINFSDSRKILQYLHPAFVIAGVHHPDFPSEEKYFSLIDDVNSPSGDALFASYRSSEEELSQIRKREQKLKKVLRKLGCYPMKRIDPGPGGSIHYAGTVPFTEELNKPGTLLPNGRLNTTHNVFVADGSGFRFLPSKGITFTLMAVAHTTAIEAMRE